MRHPRGAVNLVNLTLLLAVSAAVYFGMLWVPLWLDDLEVREAVATGWGQLQFTTDDARVRSLVLGKLSGVGTHWEDQGGKPVELKGLGLGPEDVVIERKPETNEGRVEVSYARAVRLKPLDRWWTVRFHAERGGVLR